MVLQDAIHQTAEQHSSKEGRQAGPFFLRTRLGPGAKGESVEWMQEIRTSVRSRVKPMIKELILAFPSQVLNITMIGQGLVVSMSG